MLTPRLNHLHSHYDHHESIWDIGCDHGKLGLSFLNETEVKKIHLVDPSPLVIQKLAQLIDAYITEQKSKITIHQKRGQEVMPDPSKKLVFIAGMGGKEIASICDHLRDYLSGADDLVISPHRDLLQLREKLHHSDFSLGKESVIFDEGRFYQVLSLNLRAGEKVPIFGRDIFQGEVGENYRKQQLQVFSAHQDERSRSYTEYLNGLTQRF